MTLEELKKRCEENGFKYAYGVFKETVDPPFLVSIVTDSNNFMADDKVYHKNTPIMLEYVFEEKNIEEQNKIEDIILGDIAWNKTEETYLADEKIWQVSYFFEI